MRLGVLARSIAGLLGLLLGASAEAATCAVSFGTVPNGEAIRTFHAANDGVLLLATTSGVFRLDGDRLVRIGSDQTLGVVYPGFFRAGDDTLLIGTAHGCFAATATGSSRSGKTPLRAGSCDFTPRATARS
jgi:hypothetical protein